MTLVLRYAARSDRGLVRSNNQDSVYAGPRLLALADGMGGHAAGEVASKVVIAALAPLDDDEPGDDLLGQLRDAVIAGNGAISELVQSDPDLDGMGTTLTAVLFAGSRLGMVHIGDSRAYMLRNGTFTQITHDDTFVQSLIDEGRITEEEAATHPQRSLLLRALTGHEVEPRLMVREARPGDRYLLCSDGLSGVVSMETLDEAIRIPDPQACADRMIELALKGGGPDNVTVVVADVVDVDFGEDAPIVGGAAGDGSEDPPPPDSPASRASSITGPRPIPPRVEPMPPPDPRRSRGSRLKALALVVFLLLLVVAAGLGTRWYVLRQYYVGEGDNGEVSVFRGVTGSVFGFDLHRKVEGSCPPGSQACEAITVEDLKVATRDVVRNGITDVDGLEGAREAIRRLRTEQTLPFCPKGTAENNPGSASTGTSTTAAPPTATSTEAPASTTVEGTPLTTPVQQPGTDCRKGQ
ncbi:protein phosphatase 2C domain-containing protein [Saccharothrix sp. 6-C]|uniref:Serine/threonine protein phosphatase PstP n=1 Tax=Saccharothrix texasensis TaxID=103734 RepID=A0A3N1HA38_9PSEU|nr:MULTISPECIES: protein phosphatase 2C domain-containing protein [Saccharothrix]QQQ76488.1 protein phosphatase 2C domain-containing protein [Saccharothrix sp. 6-C]ROP39296.1 protein phosphatase [Saccharothrix texasensis]